MRIDDESFAVCRAGFSARIAKRLKELRFGALLAVGRRLGRWRFRAPARSRARRARLRRRRGSHWRRASAWAHRRPASWKRSARPFRAARRFPPRRQRRWRRSTRRLLRRPAPPPGRSARDGPFRESPGRRPSTPHRPAYTPSKRLGALRVPRAATQREARGANRRRRTGPTFRKGIVNRIALWVKQS